MAVTFVEDVVAWSTMVRLAACVEQELAKSGLPGVCSSIPVPGPLAIMERCGNCGSGNCHGQAWVRFINEYPSKIFPSPDQDGNCEGPMAYTLEVGVARCLPVGKTNTIGGFTPPSNEEQILATRLQMADKAAMRRAIKCCVKDLDVSYVLGTNTPMQTTGDCGGSVWTVTIWTQ